jgi:translation initiation factor 5B
VLKSLKEKKMEGKKASSSGVHPGYFNAFYASIQNLKKDRNKNNVGDHPLRAPICCMLGAIDSGKTSLLDCMRGRTYHHGKVIHPPLDFTRTNAATYVIWRPEYPEIKLPGLLCIDTPGLPLFTHSRSQAVALCDIAILVVDITLDLNPITIESLDLLQMWNKKFIIALNHIDKIPGWKTSPKAPLFRQAFNTQSSYVQTKFSSRFRQIVTQFKQHGIEAEMYHDNKLIGETVSIVPTCAIR